MFTVRSVTSLDWPELEPYRTLRRPEDHRQKGIVVAEGEKVVRRLFASRFVVHSLLIEEAWLNPLSPLLETRPETITVFLAKKHLLETIVGYTFFQGVLAVAEIPPAPNLAALVAEARRPSCFVALDGVHNAENLGVLVRNAAAFSVDGLLAGETAGSPYLRRAARNSMGAIFHLPVLEVRSLVEALTFLRERRIRVLAAHPRAGSIPLAETNLAEDCCLVFGNEAHGVSDRVRAVCDQAVVIPTAGPVDSLNVASAAAICFYQVWLKRCRV